MPAVVCGVRDERRRLLHTLRVLWQHRLRCRRGIDEQLRVGFLQITTNFVVFVLKEVKEGWLKRNETPPGFELGSPAKTGVMSIALHHSCGQHSATRKKKPPLYQAIQQVTWHALIHYGHSRQLVLYWVSMSILFLFIIEAFMLMYVLGLKEFFSNAFYAFDFVMLIGTLVLEVLYGRRGRQGLGNGMGVIIRYGRCSPHRVRPYLGQRWCS